MNRKEIYRIDSIEVAPAKATTKYQRNGLHWSWAWVSNHIWEKTSVHTQICQVVKCESFELILQFATLWNSLRLYRKLHHKHIYVLAQHCWRLQWTIIRLGKFPNKKYLLCFFHFSFFIWLILCTSTSTHKSFRFFFISYCYLFVFRPWTYTHMHTLVNKP